MELQKTTRLRVGGLPRTKEALLRQEYEGWLCRLRRGEKADEPLYSATVQPADRLRKAVGNCFNLNRTKNYPMVLRRDCFRLEKARDTTYAGGWLKVPTAAIHGGPWVPGEVASVHAPLREAPEVSVREARVISKRDPWSVHVVLQKETVTPDLRSHPYILAVDLGERNPATAVLMAPGAAMRPMFFGREVRGVRRHHAWLRKRLQEKRAFRAIKAQRNRESRQVDAILRPAIKELVAVAKENHATIVVGDFAGGDRNTHKGSGSTALSTACPSPDFARIRGKVLDKAGWAGVPVVLVDEAYTRSGCTRCHTNGRRDRPAGFRCLSVGCGWGVGGVEMPT
jgi:IS605 OrfB family transposase